MPKTKSLAFILGFTSMIAQVVLLREIIAIFYGNEILYAVVLASWLFWVFMGSTGLSLCLTKIRNPYSWGLWFMGLTACLLPGTIVAARFLKIFLNVPTGQMIGIVPMGVAVYLLLAPLTVLLGGTFSLLCKINDEKEPGSGVQGVGTIYLWESMGAAAGGFLFSFVLIRFFSSLPLAFLLTFFVFLAVVLLAVLPRILKIGLAAALLISFFGLNGHIKELDFLFRQKQWRGLTVVSSVDSIYGNLTLTRVGKDNNLYENGLLSYSTGDDMSAEETIHFPLLMHSNPRRVLLIGNGLGGGLREALKYPGLNVDYVELDPMAIRLSERHLDPKHLDVLKDQRVKVIYSDGRWFVKSAGGLYDAVVVNLGDPYTAMINRYYTAEFFREVGQILGPEGVLSLSVSSSENYLSEENRDFLRSIHSTLKKVFPEVRSIPGDTNIFVAGKKTGSLVLDHQILVERLRERRISAKYVREYYLPFRLSPDRLTAMDDILKTPGMINTDTRPVAYLYDMILWSTHFDTRFIPLLKKFQGLQGFHWLVILPLVIFLAGLGLKTVIPSAPITISIMTTGFSEMIFQILVILAFQTLYGYAYYKIGFILASFMAGLVLGSWLSRRIIIRGGACLEKIYLWAQFAICLCPLFIPAVFAMFRDWRQVQAHAQFFAGTFALLPLLAGLLGGLQYPLALRLLDRKERDKKGQTAKKAGLLYGVDVLGAAVGALIAGTLFIPLYGINMLAYVCTGMNGAVLILLFLSGCRSTRI